MSDKIDQVLAAVSLFCPDDKTPLKRSGDVMKCDTCRREFPIHQGELIEVLPTAPSITPEFWKGYADDYREELEAVRVGQDRDGLGST